MIPVNCPYNANVPNYHSDGPMSVQNPVNMSGPNYEPNSLAGPTESPVHKLTPYEVSGKVGRYALDHPNDDYEQARILY